MATVLRRKPLTTRVGLLPVGHHTYWEQFPGLLADLLDKVAILEKRLREQTSSVVTFGMIDDAASAYEVLPQILQADLDLLFVDMVTYATSSTWGVLVRNLNVPIVLVALQPRKAMDYARGDTAMQLRNDDFCSVPEFTGVAYRMNRPIPPVILGHLHGDDSAERELSMWCRIACALHDLRNARIGLMGHVLEAMLDMHTDPTAVTAAFGCHVVLCEPEELMQHYRQVDDERIDAKKQQILSFFDAPDPGADTLAERLTQDDLTMAARTAVALEDFVTHKDLDGLAYYY